MTRTTQTESQSPLCCNQWPQTHELLNTSANINMWAQRVHTATSTEADGIFINQALNVNAAAVPAKIAVSKCIHNVKAYPEITGGGAAPPLVWVPLAKTHKADHNYSHTATQGTPLEGARAALISPASCWRLRLAVPLGCRSAVPNLDGLNQLVRAASVVEESDLGGRRCEIINFANQPCLIGKQITGTKSDLSEFRSHGRKHSNDRLRTIRDLSTKVGESVTTEGGEIVTDKDAEARRKSVQQKTPLTPSAERKRKSRAGRTEEQKEEAKDKNAAVRRETRNRTPAKEKDKAREANTAARSESRKRVTAEEKRGARAEAQATREDYSWSAYQAFLAKRKDTTKRTTAEKRSDAAYRGWEQRRKKNVRVTYHKPFH